MSFKRSTPGPVKPDLAEYAEAIATEQAAWSAVKNRLPGSTEFDQALWSQWQEAVAASDLIRTKATDLGEKGFVPDGVPSAPVRPEAGNERG